MAPLLFLLLTTALVRAIGHLARPGLKPWPVAIRWGLAVMFTVTGISHFVGMRESLIAMVPPWLPAAAALVTITGILEVLGAAGLLLRPTRIWAAIGLGLMLLLMFPANVHLALSAEDPPWDDTLLPRTVLQLIFLAAVAAVLVPELRGLRARSPRGARTPPPAEKAHNRED
ncbi:DoxX family protein [Brevibacterium renqingii]|uniref:DoxX family protein n=1 Tax=Brevibacterium renqingii TaxID=2776916 RepID=UPI001AE05152